MIAVVIFGIFLSLSYFLFQDQTKGILASVVDGVEDVTGMRISNTLAGTGSIEGPVVPEVVLVPNAESDFVFTSSTGTITSYSGTRKDVVIPSEINGVPVKIIGDSAFRDKGLISVYLPDGLIVIERNAFTNPYAGNSLTSVRLPETLTSIGSAAFSSNSLESVEIPASVTYLDAFSFAVNKLNTIVLHDGLKTICQYAFYNNKIVSVEIPKSVTNLDNYSFTLNPLTSARVATGFPIGLNVFPTTTVITRY